MHNLGNSQQLQDHGGQDSTIACLIMASKILPWRPIFFRLGQILKGSLSMCTLHTNLYKPIND